MVKGIIFDLDMTLVNSYALYGYRKLRQWSIVYSKLNETFLFDGIPELLDELRNKFKCGIVTSSPASYANRVIKYHGLNIPLLVAYHNTKMHKPHPEPIMKGIRMLGLNPDEIISIGDECKDVIASNMAGVKSVAVTWGIDDKIALQESKPRFICDSMEELRETVIYHGNS